MRPTSTCLLLVLALSCAGPERGRASRARDVAETVRGEVADVRAEFAAARIALEEHAGSPRDGEVVAWLEQDLDRTATLLDEIDGHLDRVAAEGGTFELEQAHEGLLLAMDRTSALRGWVVFVERR